MKCESIRRKRLPRGRHIAKSRAAAAGISNRSDKSRDALMEKIDRLEALVNVALGESDGGGGAADGELASSARLGANQGFSSDASTGTPLGEPGANALLSQFWTRFINEVRESTGFSGDETDGNGDDEGGDDDEEDEDGFGRDERFEERGKVQESGRGYLPFMGLSLGHTPRPHSLSIRPSPAVTAALCDIYLNHVDRIIKVLHRPSLKRHLLEGTPYPALKSSRDAENALDTAVFYAAVASMTDRQCYELFHCSRKEVLPEYQSACEMALERADLMRTTDMTVLQAFVLYLVCFDLIHISNGTGR